jgi:hypothetical protein
LCTALRHLHHDKDLRIEMGIRARQLFEDQFSIEHIAQQFNKHLNNVVNRYNNGDVQSGSKV